MWKLLFSTFLSPENIEGSKLWRVAEENMLLSSDKIFT